MQVVEGSVWSSFSERLVRSEGGELREDFVVQVFWGEKKTGLKHSSEEGG
jgi:hypothetical protein